LTPFLPVPSAETKPIVNEPAEPPVRTMSICAVGWFSSTEYVLHLGHKPKAPMEMCRVQVNPWGH
jgi:hypothetical protein